MVYRDAGQLVVSPTDLTKFLACTHLTSLDLSVATGQRSAPTNNDGEFLELLFRKGLEHEHRYLASLQARFDVVEVQQLSVAEAARATEKAMTDGASVIYQATFLHGGHRGHADFLLRNTAPSRLGDWSYDVADTKLARRLKVPALLQMAEYGEHLRRIQGIAPSWLTVVTGDSESHAYRYADVASYYRRVAQRFESFVAGHGPTIAQPVPHCDQCRWVDECSAQWRRLDHLSLIAFMRGDHRQQLEQAGIATVGALAGQDADQLPRSIGRVSRERLVSQARLQLSERTTGIPSYELLDPVAGAGLQRLPQPHEGDLYLDFEGDPFVEPAGREYLAGLGDVHGGFEAFWAHDNDQERLLTEQLVDRLLAQWQARPGMHVYHYAPYERSALQRLTSRHGVREAELDVLLRAEVFVDLYAVVRQGLRISKESYSIKKLEAFYWGQIRGANAEVAEALSSVLAYEQWIVSGESTILDKILAYNADDVRSTFALHQWLEDRRLELEGIVGYPLSRPEDDTEAEQAHANEAELAEAELAGRLLDDGRPLLAGLVGWHRREQRPAWWDLFRLADLDEDDLVEDGSALGGLSAPVHVGNVKRSHVHRYTFPPQDTRIRPGRAAIDVDTRTSAGRVVDIDPEAGWVDLSIGIKREPPTLRGLGPEGPLDDRVLRSAIAGVAELALSTEDCLGLRLLRKQVPDNLAVQPGETPTQAVIRIGTALRGAVLAVQGPPGTGKSTAGGELIRSLLDAGLTVGVTALSHQVIGSLLAKVGRPALQRCDEDNHCGAELVEWAPDNERVLGALAAGEHRLIGGTSWLWARPELAGAVDVIVIDEAGQFSLANAVAVSCAAESMVLLGDPQQLAQPSQAEHPHGAGISALEHLLDRHPTIPPDRGIFLDTTWRMHPDITEFVSQTFYEARLQSAPGLDKQVILGGAHSGSGLRWMPIVHTGNESASEQEAVAVGTLVDELLSGSWIDDRGIEQPLEPDQILVVAPYNAHVARLKRHLDPRIHIGSVDKFQGREAAVVIYSLASSSAADAPRGVDFLLDIHRLNVAVSRARAMCILVGSPALLDAEVHNPHQLRLVNALCRYVERAPHIASRPQSANVVRARNDNAVSSTPVSTIVSKHAPNDPQ